ncbi:tripartite tricarboxylate transporter TctB family protein [Ramlibacter tataouinensis]|uniref:Candidate small integral membrane protein n=1 Tax=Ramlibacter tataouinensis (strain ATCC BAA-407 / DSM 14655 / LMG 21543 / TTB310) TaxID=365046 RepID=F5Y132_RAMTT|nr:tripartite tricarboxylate transporter TctB family protein [Ramlibacter tataouinensis]AEG92250.1 Candidate small integral membrane protein [Ramlibacter tataouinensis TTB310]
MASGLKIRNQKDFAAGVIYIAFGAAFSLGALNYSLGDPARMGPGWFPFWVGILLALSGVVTALAGLRRDAAAEKIKRPDLRTMAIVLGSVVLFGLLLIPMGLVAALCVLILGSSFASHEFTWKGALASTVLLTLFCVGVFIYGINLQMPLWPSFLTR